MTLRHGNDRCISVGRADNAYSRLVAVLRTFEPSDRRLRNAPFMFDKSSVRITNKISQSAFASDPTLTSGCISQR